MSVASPPLICQLLRSGAHAPQRMSDGAAGYDLRFCGSCDVKVEQHTLTVPARGRALVPTGLALAIPPTTYGRIAPRSGLAVRHGIGVGAGVVDSDYRGEVHVVLLNHSDDDFEVREGDRVAQLILERCELPEVETMVHGELPASPARGTSGFGSTGR